MYEHDYKGEDDATRIARLEKFVFGDVQTGSLDQRLANLNEAVVVAPPKKAAPQASSDEKTYPAFDYGSYPRVNELEQHMLSMTYPKEPLQQRLARLETKAFGKPSTSMMLVPASMHLILTQRGTTFFTKDTLPILIKISLRRAP